MKKNILVIDDEEAVRKSFVLALEDSEYDVQTVASAEEGIRSFSENKPDLVFLDLKMPGMNGVECLRELRQLDPKVPIHIQTAFFKEFLDLLNAAVQDGLKFEVVNKPMSSEQIVAIAQGVLERPTEY